MDKKEIYSNSELNSPISQEEEEFFQSFNLLYKQYITYGIRPIPDKLKDPDQLIRYKRIARKKLLKKLSEENLL